MTTDRIENVPHTSGPWLVSDPHSRCTNLHILQAQKDEVGARAVVAEVAKILDGTGHANARLIATAPELLDALDYLLEQTVDMDLKYGITLSEGEEDARERALEAIAKARGENAELAA